MKSFIITAIAISSIITILWVYQACFRSRFLSIEIPFRKAHINHPEGLTRTTYNIAIHKSQVNPFFTLWVCKEYQRIKDGKEETD